MSPDTTIPTSQRSHCETPGEANKAGQSLRHDDCDISGRQHDRAGTSGPLKRSLAVSSGGEEGSPQREKLLKLSGPLSEAPLVQDQSASALSSPGAGHHPRTEVDVGNAGELSDADGGESDDELRSPDDHVGHGVLQRPERVRTRSWTRRLAQAEAFAP